MINCISVGLCDLFNAFMPYFHDWGEGSVEEATCHDSTTRGMSSRCRVRRQLNLTVIESHASGAVPIL